MFQVQHEVVGFVVGNSNITYQREDLPYRDPAPFFLMFVGEMGETVGWSHQCFTDRQEAVEAGCRLGLCEVTSH